MKILNYLKPNLYISNITELNLLKFRERGFNALLIDLDNTILPWGEWEVGEKVKGWIKEAYQLGYKICIISNASNSRITSISEILKVPFVNGWPKPWVRLYYKAFSLLGVTSKTSIIVGDQLFTDILGGNRCGAFTVLVKPLSKKEFFTTRLMRIFERIVFSRLKLSLHKE